MGKKQKNNDAADANIKDQPNAAKDKAPAAKRKKTDDHKASGSLDTKSKREKPTQKTTKAGGAAEIDDLFDSLKGKKSKPQEEKPKVQPKEDKASKSKENSESKKLEGNKDDIFGTDDGKRRKRTEEGYVIYSEEELGFAKKGAGDTDLCPFDCECCF